MTAAKIETAILLAAGEGSRLRSVAPHKPLCEVGGMPLIAHALTGLAAAGMKRAVVVLGYGADMLETYLGRQAWPLAVETVTTDDYRQPNGVSVLAAERAVAGADALLAMCDHLLEPALYRRVAESGASGGARLGIDRNITSDLVDIEDVTCVRTEGEHIIGIGKGLEAYDCFDTGVFAIGPALFEALRSLRAPSLTEGMRVLAELHKARVVDCEGLRWIDVDDEAALRKAEDWLELAKSGSGAGRPGPGVRRPPTSGTALHSGRLVRPEA